MAGTPRRSATTTVEEPGRLVRWPRPGSEGGSRGLTFVEEPDLVRALDQLGAAMAAAKELKVMVRELEAAVAGRNAGAT